MARLVGAQTPAVEGTLAVEDTLAGVGSLAEEGILVGVSSGAVCAAALQVAHRLGKGKTILAIFCDTGERYLTTDLFQAEGI